MKHIALLGSLVWLTISFATGQNDTAWVSLERDGEKIELNRDFELKMVYNNAHSRIIYKPKIQDNFFLLPRSMNGDSVHFFVFEYKDVWIYSLFFRNMYDGNTYIDFYYDSAPFNDTELKFYAEEFAMESDEYEYDDIELVVRVCNSYAYGCGDLYITDSAKYNEQYKTVLEIYP